MSAETYAVIPPAVLAEHVMPARLVVAGVVPGVLAVLSAFPVLVLALPRTMG